MGVLMILLYLARKNLGAASGVSILWVLLVLIIVYQEVVSLNVKMEL
jgi:hypothetical protein